MLTAEEKRELEILEAIEAGRITQDEGQELMQLEMQSAPQKEYLEESAPISAWDRFVVKNFSQSPEKSFNYLQKSYPDLEFEKKDDRIFARTRGSNEAFKALDPDADGFDGVGEFLQDTGDILWDVGSGIGEGLATAGAGIAGAAATAPAGGVGAIPAAMAGGASAGAAAEASRQKIGDWLGLDQEVSGSDVALSAGLGAASPLLLGTGAGAKQMAKKGLKDLAKSQKGLVGRGYEKVTRDYAPTIGAALSGTDKEALKKAVKDPKFVNEIADDVYNYTDTNITMAKEAVSQKKMLIGNKMNEHMRDSNVMINIGDMKADIDGKIEDLISLADTNPEKFSTKKAEYLDQLLELRKTAFENADGSDIPEFIDADRMFDLKQSLTEFKGAKTIFDKTGRERTVDKRFKTYSTKLYDALNNRVDNAFQDAPVLRDEYSQVLKDESLLQKRFKQAAEYPERDVNQLMKMSKSKGSKNQLKEFDKAYGTNLVETGDNARSVFQYADPSLLPQSSDGVVSTGRIAASSAVGAQLLSDLIGTRAGAAAGLIGGAYASSPSAISKMGRGAYGLEKGVRKMTPQIPLQQSYWNLMQSQQRGE